MLFIYSRNVVLFILSLLLINVDIYGQVVIGGDHKPTSKSYVLLELKVDHTKDTAQGFMLPMAKTGQRDSITKTKNKPNNKFPKGGVVYNVTQHTIDIWTKKNHTSTTTSGSPNEWRSLAYEANSKDVPEIISLDSTFITSPTTSTNGNLQTITLQIPNDYKPYTYPKNGGTNNDSLVVNISYNGFKLVPYKDFTPTISTSSGSNPPHSVKITFLTLVPETKTELGKILVQCVKAK